MIRPCCMMCSKELDEPGAILLASPVETGMCAKYHICVRCEKLLHSFIMGLKIKMMMRKKRGAKK